MSYSRLKKFTSLLTMHNIPIGSENHSFTGTVKLQLHPLIVLPLLRDVQSDFEPNITPAWTKVIPFLCGFVSRSLGFFESRFGSIRGSPCFEFHVCGIVKTMGEEKG